MSFVKRLINYLLKADQKKVRKPVSINSIFSIADSQFMVEAIQLARRGLYTATPNPCVGCVLVKDEKVVGRGWHVRAGDGHAEVNAIADAGDNAKGATAYISLEPCSFTGKTGACTDVLQAAGIVRVVSAMEDPNPNVSGQGSAILRAAGLDVSEGLMAEQAATLNRGFIKRMQKQLPFVSCKMAMSLDGRSAMASGESQWITSPSARQQVQQLRASSCAIVTGVGTIIHDDPSLNVREQDLSAPVERQPALVIVDSQLKTPLSAKVVSTEMLATRDVYIACVNAASADRVQALEARGVKVMAFSNADENASIVNLSALLSFLAEREMNHVMIESGPTLAGQFVQQCLVDELKLFVAPKLMGGNAMPAFSMPFENMSEAMNLTITDTMAVGPDWLLTCHIKNSDKGLG
ncbi:MAG: bifunctional diaminohydroxyphosphoribosylaminopyrimidine deaminase/5-amino-6-(5-phosphoribosylamino)uracil reductase RibD [Cellvibrionales bacterium]|jgi:diaminohydroxyphosphoribosylaminopyrimidine deaminase/5-amino-6-(5-phosphoribosylamino)uracil reductase|nr:bifunctional diaminohydroxyphosphoribosylaminopyrimidine deaminase/5-amino-6-(5-phosphoribosylamino)uracil reductase RibD [Cellvibrionales bacterium]